MKNIGQMMKQAQQMQAKMTEMQQKLGDMIVDGASGAGMVKVALNGKGELKQIKIAPALLDPQEVEVLEDLIVAAFNDAKNKVEAHIADETQKMMGGMGLPGGFKLPF